MYKEIIGNLFNNNDNLEQHIYYAQCISNDLTMKAGIAKEFNLKFDTRHNVHEAKEAYRKNNKGLFSKTYDCIFQSPVFCIITKERFWHKPSITDFEKAIKNFKFKIIETNKTTKIKEIRCPMLGCGLDRLKWDEVKPILQRLAEELELHKIDLVIYKLK